MSRTANDPHVDYGKSEGVVTKAQKEQRRFEEMQVNGQWARCRGAGLTIHLHHPNTHFAEMGAWVKADDVEATIKAYEVLINEALGGDPDGAVNRVTSLIWAKEIELRARFVELSGLKMENERLRAELENLKVDMHDETKAP